jgi:chromosome segregation ATPase
MTDQPTPPPLTEVEWEEIHAQLTGSGSTVCSWARKYGSRLLAEVQRQAEEIAALKLKKVEYGTKLQFSEAGRDRLQQANERLREFYMKAREACASLASQLASVAIERNDAFGAVVALYRWIQDLEKRVCILESKQFPAEAGEGKNDELGSC